MTTYLLSAGIIIAAYLLGSLACAIIVCRLLGLPDPRSQGSGNPGATNVLRLGGKLAAILTLLGDLLKGVIAVFVAKSMGVSPLVIGLTALAVFLGHLYPLFFKFQGGKGVATSLGVLLVLAWPVGVAVLLIWLLVAGITRYSSLAALVAAVFAPIVAVFMTHLIYLCVIIVISLLLIFRHRKNIRNLWQGKERKIGQRS